MHENIKKNYGMWHIKLRVFLMRNSNMESFLRKTKILKQIWTKNLDQKFKRVRILENHFFSNYGMSHIKLRVFLLRNSNIESTLWKIKILKEKLDQNFGPKIQKIQEFGKSIFLNYGMWYIKLKLFLFPTKPHRWPHFGVPVLIGYFRAIFIDFDFWF